VNRASRLVSVLPLLALAVLAGCSFWPAETNPYTTIHPSTDFGEVTQHMYSMVAYWVLVIAIGVFSLLAFVLIRFRDDGSPGNPKQVHGNPQLEFAWTMLPVAIVIAITIPTIRAIFQIGDAAPQGSVEVRVVGRRWWWAFEYKDGSNVVTANELHLPVGKPVSLQLDSDTVIHSFWVPRLGGKRDAVPGRTNRIWFTIKDKVEAGAAPLEYLGECAEYCGDEHARMRMRVYAHDPADFTQWQTDMTTPATFADPEVQAKGEKRFTELGCGGCHTVVGNSGANGKTGPSLTRFGQRHSVGAGAAPFEHDDRTPFSEQEKIDVLTKWLHNPDDIKLGTTEWSNPGRAIDGMNIPRETSHFGTQDAPSDADYLTDEEIHDLVAYLLAMK